MENFGKDLLCDIEEQQYGMYIGHNVVYLNEKLIKDPKAKYTVEPVTQKVAAHFYYVAKNTRELSIYDRIIREKVVEDFGDNSDGSNRVTVASDSTKLHYCVVASEVDYSSQDIIQPDFSIKHKMKELATKPNRMNYFFYYSDLTQTMKEIGIYNNTEELKNNLLEDMVKAYKMGYIKESVQEDTVGIDQYGFWMIPITIYETIPDGTGSALVEDYTIYFAAKNKKQTETYESIVKEKLLQEFNVEIIGGKRINQDKIKQWLADGQSRISVKTEWPTYCYSVVAASFDFSTQDMLQPDYSIKQNLKNIINPKGHVDYRFQKGLYSDLLLKAISVGIYKKEDKFKNYYFEDMVKMVQLGLDSNITECCCAGGIGGGVTTASFAPAVTHTQYPRPGSKKKKKSKKEDAESETIDDVYGFYYCTIYVWIDFHKTGDIKTIYFRVFGKNLDEIDKYNQQINNNIKIIGSDSRILQTTLSDKYYSIAVKDFDFDNQKILDSNLYTNINTPMDFETSYNIIQNDIDNISSKVLSDYTNKLTDFTSDLFTKMTEDTDDVYWPVRNDETDAFEQEIRNQRQVKKDKIIARKEKVIAKREKTLSDWLQKMAQNDQYSTLAIQSQVLKFNASTAKIKADLNRIKKLPLDSPEFF